jgi:hypothetical protein
VSNKLFAGFFAAALTAFAAGCGGDVETANMAGANANAGALATTSGNADAGVRTAPDESEIRTETAGGVTTETRTFRNPNSRVERVVVTTREGRRTARVYYRDKTVRELPEGEVERALSTTADALASAGGKVVDVSKEVGSEVGDKAEDAAGKAADAGREVGDKAEDVGGAAAKGAKAVGSEAADKAEDAGGAAASGAKKAGKATVKGAKKAGGAIKDAVTP